MIPLRTAYPPALLRRLMMLTAGIVVLLVGIALLLKPGASFGDVLGRAGPDVAPALAAALGLTWIIAAGAMDLSIGSGIAVAGTVFGVLVHRSTEPWICYAACLLTMVVLVLVNAGLIRWLGLPAIIVTLGTLAIYRGLALMLAEIFIPGFGGNLSVQADAYHRPGKDWVGVILIAVIAVALVWEHAGAAPRRWLALGNSEEALRLNGVSPANTLLGAFAAGGLFLGVAALLYVTRIQSIEPARIALGFELQVIGAVVLGGTNIFGGQATGVGTVLGTFFLYFIGQGMTYANISPYWQEVVTGTIILGVIGLDCALQRRRRQLEELS